MARRYIALVTTGMCTLSLAALGGCADDMGYAQDSAKLAAGFVVEMHRTVSGAIQKQRGAQQDSLVDVERMTVAAENKKGDAAAHRSAWGGAKTDESLKYYDAMQKLTSAEELTKTAPFIIMTPPPTFDTPAVDDKSFTDLAEGYTKLSRSKSPLKRANELLPYLQAAAGALSKSTAEAETTKNKLAITGTDLGSATLLQQSKAMAATVSLQQAAARKDAGLQGKVPPGSRQTKSLPALIDSTVIVPGLKLPRYPDAIPAFDKAPVSDNVTQALQ